MRKVCGFFKSETQKLWTAWIVKGELVIICVVVAGGLAAAVAGLN